MKVITLTQPWAALVALGAKHIETRSWSTTYRGPLAIHAGQGLGPVGGLRGLAQQLARPPFAAALTAAGYHVAADLPRGCIVAVAELVDVVPVEALRSGEIGRFDAEGAPHLWQLTPEERAFGNYAPGRYGWLLANVRRLREPIPARGALGLWTPVSSVQELLETAIRKILIALTS